MKTKMLDRNISYREMVDSYSLASNSNVFVANTVSPFPAISSWGPKRDPLTVVIPITVIYALIFFTGILGNISTCIVIARNKHMHTATNYYLFSLAISDLLLLISGLPPEMYYIWSRYPYVFGEVFCVIQGFAAETSANATVLTITAFTVERYVAICHPFQSHRMSKLSRAVKFVIAIWMVALCLAIPQAIQFGIVHEQLADGRILDEEHIICSIKRVVIPHSFEISTFLFFVGPMTLITILYIVIGLQLHKSSVLARRDKGSVKMRRPTHFKSKIVPPGESKSVVVCVTDATVSLDEDEDGRKNFAKNAQTRASKHVVKMLIAVVVAFFICWAPFHAQRLLAVYGNGERRSAVMVAVYNILTYTSGILYYLSTTVNPVLYHIMSNKFREAFKDTLSRYLGRRRCREDRWRCYSVLSTRSSHHSNNSSGGCQSNSNTSQRSSNSIRYLEADIARLHESKRPVVVSFKRHTSTPTSNLNGNAVTDSVKSPLPESIVELDATMIKAHRERKRYKQNLKTRFLKTAYLNILSRNSHPSHKIRNDSKKTENENIFKLVPATTTTFNYDTDNQDCLISSPLGKYPLVEENFSDVNFTEDEGMHLPCVVGMAPVAADAPILSDYPGIEGIKILREQQFKFVKPINNSKKPNNPSKIDNRNEPFSHAKSYSKIEQYVQERNNEDENYSQIDNRDHSFPLKYIHRSVTMPMFDEVSQKRCLQKNKTLENYKYPQCKDIYSSSKVYGKINNELEEVEDNHPSYLGSKESHLVRPACSAISPAEAGRRRNTFHNVFEDTFEQSREQRRIKIKPLNINSQQYSSLPCCQIFSVVSDKNIEEIVENVPTERKKLNIICKSNKVSDFVSLDTFQNSVSSGCDLKPSASPYMNTILQPQFTICPVGFENCEVLERIRKRKLKSFDDLIDAKSLEGSKDECKHTSIPQLLTS